MTETAAAAEVVAEIAGTALALALGAAVVLYVTEYCGFCRMAEGLLRRLGAQRLQLELGGCQLRGVVALRLQHLGAEVVGLLAQLLDGLLQAGLLGQHLFAAGLELLQAAGLQALLGGLLQRVLALQVGLAQWTADLDAMVQTPQLNAIDWNGRVLRLTRRNATDDSAGVLVAAWSRRVVDGKGQWLRWQSPPVRTRADWRQAWEQAAQWARTPGDAEQDLSAVGRPARRVDLVDAPLGRDLGVLPGRPHAEPAAVVRWFSCVSWPVTGFPRCRARSPRQGT